MSTYAAEVTTSNAPGDVVRVIVGTPEWATQNLGGNWVVTDDPYNPSDGPLRYTGPGQHHDPGVPEKFVGDEWTNEKATVPDSETGEYFYNTEGMLTWYQGKAWRNLSPTGTPNVWEPGVANWREYPLDNGVPVWVQPVGSVDAYPLGFRVKHSGVEWLSQIEANVWEPGAAGAESLWAEDPPPPLDEGAVPMMDDEGELPPEPDWKFYTVQAGDTLFSLVERANQRPGAEDITIDDAVEWNGLGSEHLIFEGMVLRYI